MKAYAQVTSFLLFALFLLAPLKAQQIEEQSCQALANLRILDVNLLSATVVPATEELPEYCRVLGFVLPAINFEIKLPMDTWNGKMFMSGCGGMCGRLNPNWGNDELKRNYAVSGTDTGHWSASIFEGRWAFDNRQAEIDYGHRGLHETAKVTKIIIEAFYGEQPQHSYFDGCSNGGRQAHMEAWRYPEDFDGIISSAPVMDIIGLGAAYYSWILQANTDLEGNLIIKESDVALIKDAVYEACDGLDGLEDGLIDDPRVCEFDPTILKCKSEERTGCLTNEQVETLQMWYSKPKDSTGRALYSDGVPLGSEPYWYLWITGQTTERGQSKGIAMQINEELLRYAAFEEDPGEHYTGLDFDFDKDPARIEFMASILNSDNPDLSSYRERGGKLLMYHGWADVATPPLKSINYYKAVEERVGSIQETQEFLRLFLLPGAGHCGEPNGPGMHGRSKNVNALTALENWVEQGTPPDYLMTTKENENGGVLWTRPVCPYPQKTSYKGQGDMNDASSFECVDP